MITQDQIEQDLLEFARREIFSSDIAIDVETDLMAAGFDSMSLVRVLQFVEKRHHIWIPEGELTGDALRNLRSLAATVHRLLSNS